MRRVLAILSFLGLCAASGVASERHFTYTYESSVLQRGGREIEPWNTFRLGRTDFYSRLDTRIEVELGLTDRLQTSLYLNLSTRAQDTELGRESETELEGISSEWKLKLADPVADPVGFALYGEVSGGPTELELEGKLILDKRSGRWLAAVNLTAEQEWEFEPEDTEKEFLLEGTAAGAYFVTPRLTAGLELRSHTVFPPEDEPTRSALFLGPAVSYTREGWWVAASVLPQLVALSGKSDGNRDLVEHEKLELRVLFGLEF